jgi:hypothetical protein
MFRVTLCFIGRYTALLFSSIENFCDIVQVELASDQD